MQLLVGNATWGHVWERVLHKYKCCDVCQALNLCWYKSYDTKRKYFHFFFFLRFCTKREVCVFFIFCVFVLFVITLVPIKIQTH